MVKLISGVTQVAGSIKTPASGPFTLSPHDEKRLVEAGVAIYVKNGTAQAVATPPVATPASGQGNTLPGAEGPVEELARPAYDTNMKADDLRALMKEHGVTVKVGMSKADMVAALDAHFDGAEADPDDDPVEDGEELPVPGAEGPVV